MTKRQYDSLCHRLAPAVFVSMAVGAAGFATSDGARAIDTITSGADEYAWNCSDCHGMSGRGDGPLAPILIKRPADLTKLAKQNEGQFPFERIRQTISGQQEVTGHQSLQMPDYWARFRRDEGRRGYDSAADRITAITEYLRSIQE